MVFRSKLRTTFRTGGFTIVELLIVVVVIAILAAISVVAYSGIQSRAQDAKIKSDLAMLQKAITVARINSGTPLFNITQHGAPEAGCLGKATGTDLATLNKSSDSCWTLYNTFLDRVSNSANIDVRGMTDPWGRPYYVNPNEDENTTSHVCMADRIGVYSQPFVYWTAGQYIMVPLYKASC